MRVNNVSIFLNFSTNSLPLFSAIPILSQNQKNCKYHWNQEVDYSSNFILRCWTSYQLKKMIFRYLIKFQKLKHSISFICRKFNYKARKTNRKKTLRGKVTRTDELCAFWSRKTLTFVVAKSKFHEKLFLRQAINTLLNRFYINNVMMQLKLKFFIYTHLSPFLRFFSDFFCILKFMVSYC